MVGLKCSSGDTLTEGKKIAMTNIVVPECVISLAITIPSGDQAERLSQGLNRFEREDPTFKVTVDEGKFVFRR